jgi:hypothetical protein
MQTTATFLPMSGDLSNPERGFYGWAASRLQKLTPASLMELREGQGLRLVLGLIDLSAHRTSPLTSDFLETLVEKFDLLRDAGLKAVLRPVYNYDSRGADASLAQVRAHLDQLAPVLHAHADAIGYVQAGFIGAWGEWHGSPSGLTTDTNKAAVRDALLAAVPPQFPVQFRYPYDVIKWFPRALEPSRAFDGSAQSRTGVHNDCFLSSDNDVGTYTINSLTRNSQRDYTRAITEYTPFGGETCRGFGPLRKGCADILSEGAAYHLSYLNIDFYKAFMSQWKADGCYAQVTRSMGYRIQLDAIEHPAIATPGASIEFDIALRNVGWSRIFSPRPLVIVLTHGATGIVFQGSSAFDVRQLPSQADTSTRMTVGLMLPTGAPVGRYAVSVALPDIYAGTAADARQAVRFANADRPTIGQVWNHELGNFDTGTSVAVA